jgi:hypothetical protein
VATQRSEHESDPPRIDAGRSPAGLAFRVWQEPGPDAVFRAVLSLSGSGEEEHLSAASLDELCELLLVRFTYLKMVASIGGRPIPEDDGLKRQAPRRRRARRPR